MEDVERLLAANNVGRVLGANNVSRVCTRVLAARLRMPRNDIKGSGDDTGLPLVNNNLLKYTG